MDKEKMELDEKIRALRVERYALQSVARKVLPNEKVAKCLRQVNNKYVTVHKHLKTDRAFYSGLRVCGRPWVCPVCAAKISEKRVKELRTAFQAHKKNGGCIAMLTITFSHDRTDNLADILERFNQASQELFRGKTFDNIRKEMGIIGRIKSLEVTWNNENGFHPHAHVALFYTNKKTGLVRMEARMFRLWKAACAKFGLKTTAEHGLDLQNGEEAESYLSKHEKRKWNLEQEMAKGYVKKGKLISSFTPFDFLRAYLETDNERFLYLFEEYAKATKGRRQLHWSRGLKKQFLITEKTDEELAKEKTENADILGLLNLDQWKMILRQDSGAEFLNICETLDFESALKIFCSQNSTPEKNFKE